MVAKANHLWQTGQTVRIRFNDGDMSWQMDVKAWAQDILQHANLRFLWFHYYWPKSPRYETDIQISFGDGDEKTKWLVVSPVGTETYMHPSITNGMKLNAVATAFKEVEVIKTELRERGIRKEMGTEPLAENEYADTPKEYLEYLIEYYLNTARFQVRHEFGHALGLCHEQRHPESGIPWANPEQHTMRVQDVICTGYDPASIMHYPSQQYEQHIKEGEKTPLIKSNYELSEGDIKGIRMLYPLTVGKRDIPIAWEGMTTNT